MPHLEDRRTFVVIDATLRTLAFLSKVPHLGLVGGRLPPMGLTRGQQMKRDCAARLRELLFAGEEVLAVGTADEFREAKGDLGGQGAWKLMLLADQRVLFANWAKREAGYEEISLMK
jgi:hypothetical protein